MAQCEVCGENVVMPFICRYCNGAFCSPHRLPENHKCPSAKYPPKLAVSRRRNANSGYPDFGKPRRGPSINLRSVELRHLLIAWMVLGVAFSIGTLYRIPSAFPLMFGVSLLTLGLGFIGHEMSHRVVARRLGCWAEFRLWAWGLIMALVLAVASGGAFIFAAPGAVYITPGLRHAWGSSIARRDNGYISLAGPAANIVVAMGFLLLAPAGGLLGFIGERGYQINLFLAGFNLLPFGMLDGHKVLSWSPMIWAAVAVPVWALWALTFLF